MEFQKTSLEGIRIVSPKRHSDDRGFFARTWCRQEFIQNGLNPNLVQCNVSFNRLKGTIRGMHWQVPPHEETKLVRCTAGRILDVVVDLRPQSITYLQHLEIELDSHSRNAIYIPKGFAHGFQTLEDNSEILYQMSTEFHAPSATGIRWNDPSLQISWPLPIAIISTKDAGFPDYTLKRELT